MSLTKTPICDFGKKADHFKLKSTENKIISLNDAKGEKGTLIMFICNHCPYVKAVIEEVVSDCKELEKEGINVEVIDLRSIVPLDMETVLESVSKTQRLLVVDEDYLSFGLTGEIITRVIENLGPNSLKQIKRHAVPDVPIPAARSIEEVIMPSQKSIERILIEMSKGQ